MTNPYREAHAKTPNPHISRDQLINWLDSRIFENDTIQKQARDDRNVELAKTTFAIVETLDYVKNFVLQLPVENL